MSSEVVPPEFSRTISYGGVAYKIYSHSFLHYGQVKFFRSRERERGKLCPVENGKECEEEKEEEEEDEMEFTPL